MRLDQSSQEISALVEKIRSGELDLQPDFQRGSIWPDGKKRRLIDTILRQWYVPAIHVVVNDELDKEEVLDGQQRLRAIIEFMDDKFTVDGNISPPDEHIKRLSGLKYSELPTDVRSRFRRYTIATVRLKDYQPEEPGELFFRLNQISSLTAAEQRNALFGVPRNQVRSLRAKLEEGLGGRRIGFTNARMNFDDTLSRLATTLELGRLDEKLTASRLEKRYREGKGFSKSTIRTIERAISSLCEAIVYDVKLNKASLFSWLYYLTDNNWASQPIGSNFFTEFFIAFEAARGGTDAMFLLHSASDSALYERLSHESYNRESISIYNDRSSSRVNDVSSVLLRDLCLNVCAYSTAPSSVKAEDPFPYRSKFLSRTIKKFQNLPAGLSERSLVEAALAKQWEAHRALS